MRHSIATVSLPGSLAEKLSAAAAAGFDGVELFDEDLEASSLSAHQVARRCADLGLSIDLYQPVRDVEGVAPPRFPEVLQRVRNTLDVMTELGAGTFLACSNADDHAVDDLDLSAEQLHVLGELAADAGVTFAFEALAWGRHVNRITQAWDLVTRADHPSVTLAVDTFHMLARGDGNDVFADIPGTRIGFLQIADSPDLDIDVLDRSRRFRRFPGEGALDVDGVVAAVLATGYDGPLSLEIFGDRQGDTDPYATARDGRRSLVALEERLRRHPHP